MPQVPCDFRPDDDHCTWTFYPAEKATLSYEYDTDTQHVMHVFAGVANGDGFTGAEVAEVRVDKPPLRS